ncbi:endonuclease/exonuclease/phosphatase family protein [Vibrio sp. ZSDE26]|uniref:Endonuclease/exonuclease/phosphatase family protein n=1 Tax=Vibrio amylolyticus TaxID=2847292 RepID=A0A9X1XHX0_9VIBR|nr:endonuclease/exonuclease/phosphatase family protein [Vibrio amylolyticus]
MIWLLLLAPAVIFSTFSQIKPSWWLENIFAYPALFIFYYGVLLIFSLIIRDKKSAVASLIFMMFCFSLAPRHNVSTATCENASKFEIVQFNLYYDNPDINSYVNELIQNPADLVIMQEVSPEMGEMFYMLDDIFPYRYGGQPAIGYPSSQLILSKYPLHGFSVFHTPDAQNVISGEWQVTPENTIHLITAHPPSPRNKQLWYRRDALIRTIEAMVETYPYPDTLIVGDFNLSANSLLFNRIFSEFQTYPVASWPNWNPYFQTPALSMIAIDHLWLKSDTDSWSICSRKAITDVKGSDHLMIRTKISTKKG